MSRLRLSQARVRWRVPLGWILGLLALLVAQPSPWLYTAGVTLASMGEALRIWASGHLARGEGVTRSGPYAWSRNPLYLGSLLLGSGFGLATGRVELLAAFALFLLGVYVPVMRTEAAHLAERYPADYAEYAREVPLFIPRPGRRARPVSTRFSWSRVRRNREHLTVVGCALAACLLWWKMNG